jgi:D-alanyl-D-alanine dipeptidase
MKQYIFAFLLITVIAGLNKTFAEDLSPLRLLKKSKQLLLVVSADWQVSQGMMQRYARDTAHYRWVSVGTPIPVVIGKNGMAWGVNVSNAIPLSGPKKKEGDGRTPAGAYNLGLAFGFAFNPQQKIPDIKLGYFPLTAASICVDDPTSPYYNQLLNSSSISSWNSQTTGENMLYAVPQYTWGIVVNYNTMHKPGAGSCIFMHVWKTPAKGTAGCIAMEQNKIINILGWLDRNKMPVIVILPKEMYVKLQSTWNLPHLTGKLK